MHDERNSNDVDSTTEVVLSSGGFADEVGADEYPPDEGGPTSPDDYEPGVPLVTAAA